MSCTAAQKYFKYAFYHILHVFLPCTRCRITTSKLRALTANECDLRHVTTMTHTSSYFQSKLRKTLAVHLKHHHNTRCALLNSDLTKTVFIYFIYTSFLQRCHHYQLQPQSYFIIWCPGGNLQQHLRQVNHLKVNLLKP